MLLVWMVLFVSASLIALPECEMYCVFVPIAQLVDWSASTRDFREWQLLFRRVKWRQKEHNGRPKGGNETLR